ncbi:DEAD/DEAH box helicase [Streptomyces galbus]|uniref:RNA helicase n=1 Tax=Streptomyces galbus TaxID=33898 RepID=A0ABX1IMW7_STRGB|nr:DEAD/DEAH box helicase [Streptomyces galbus]NKQ26470.1 DEAD/DEAH box helicase [Streptomyces galbus]
MTLPVALSGTDVIGQAKTGTGKTLGFGLPLLERVTVPADVEAGRARPEDLTDAPQALVVVPTRELCTQVTNDLLTAGKVRNVRVTAIYGGRAYEPQVEALKKGVDVVVGTPGRLLDLAGQKKLDLKHIRSLVLDEADEMLDLGFLPDVEKIIDMLPVKRQTMLFSATMPGAVIGLARRYMSRPTHIRATAPDDEGATVANIKQFVYRAHNMDKPEMVARILQAEGRGLAMIFCRTKRTAADIAEQLQRRGFASGAVHGDLGQGAREQALRAFRNGKVDVLVCTDVAARGIDVEGVTHVINYQSPEDEKTYLHRVGRTGRAGAKGTAITFVDWDDIPRWQLINKALELNFPDPVETYSSSPHLFSDLGIPEGTKGVLPRSERTRAGLDAEELEDLGEPGGRGPRGRGGRGGRAGGRDESRPADRERTDRSDRSDRAERTPRRRRRTRGGTALDAARTPVGTSPEAPEQAPAADEAAGPRTPRRRRRTRNGSSTEAAAAATTAAAPEAAQAAVVTAERPALDIPAPAESPEAQAPETDKPRRRRTRRTAEATPTAVGTGTVTVPEPAAPVGTETTAEPAEVTETKPRRRTRKAAVAAEPTAEAAEAVATPAQPAAEVADAAEAATVTKPRRTRKTAAAKAAEVAAVDTAEAAEAPVEAAVETKPRRTRKTAAPKAEAAQAAEAALDSAEAAEAKPRRRTTRKAAQAAEGTEAVASAVGASATAEAPVEAAAATKPRRTRKPAAPEAEAAVATAEGAEAAVEAKPRRTRKTAAAKAAPAAEVTEAAVEATEAKPRRTRKTAAAKAAPAAEVTDATVEAKPRRTRKTAAAAEVPGDGGEVKPKARRTRKATAAAEAAEPTES